MSGTGRAGGNGRAPVTALASHDGTGASGIIGIQRARMLIAMTEVASERGVGGVTVAQVVERAGVSRRTFYEVFGDVEDCLLAAFDEAADRVAAVVVPAYQQAGRWHEQVRSSLVALLGLFDEEPLLARLVVVESLAGGRSVMERRGRAVTRAIAAVEEGGTAARRASSSSSAPSPVGLVAEGVVGAVLSVLHARLSSGERGRLVELVNPLMSMIVLPYLGSAAARRELERVPPRVNSEVPPSAANPLKRLEMRLTYRTVRVLMAVALSPGGSNRAIGEGAGVDDQGQISKLLSRLEKLGLVANTSPAPSGRGAPNAWTLTKRGEEVRSALAASS